jgi:hypothetical protein
VLLGLADDDWRCSVLGEPVLRYLIMREEELIHLLVIGHECFLHHVVEGSHDDVVLVEVGSIGAGASFLYG